MKQRTTTHLASERIKMAENTTTIMEQLNYSELQRNEFLYECGLSFLGSIYPELHPKFKEHVKSALYWNWYKLQFSNCEQSFCRRTMKIKNLPLSVLQTMYSKDMIFFCTESEAIKSAFKNYLKIAK